MKKIFYYLSLSFIGLFLSCEKKDLFKPKIDTKIGFTTLDDLGSIEFKSDTKEIDSLRWEFGDGTFSTKKDPMKIYLDNGKWTVKYTAFKAKWEYFDSLKVEIKNYPKDTLNFYSLFLTSYANRIFKDYKFSQIISFLGTIGLNEYDRKFHVCCGENNYDAVEVKMLNFESENLKALSEEPDFNNKIGFVAKKNPFIIIVDNLNPKGFKASKLGIFDNNKIYKTVKITSNSMVVNFNGVFDLKKYGGAIGSFREVFNNAPFTLKKVDELNQFDLRDPNGFQKKMQPFYYNKGFD
jgi:hypothetical protein